MIKQCFAVLVGVSCLVGSACPDLSGHYKLHTIGEDCRGAHGVFPFLKAGASPQELAISTEACGQFKYEYLMLDSLGTPSVVSGSFQAPYSRTWQTPRRWATPVINWESMHTTASSWDYSTGMRRSFMPVGPRLEVQAVEYSFSRDTSGDLVVEIKEKQGSDFYPRPVLTQCKFSRISI